MCRSWSIRSTILSKDCENVLNLNVVQIRHDLSTQRKACAVRSYRSKSVKLLPLMVTQRAEEYVADAEIPGWRHIVLANTVTSWRWRRNTADLKSYQLYNYSYYTLHYPLNTSLINSYEATSMSQWVSLSTPECGTLLTHEPFDLFVVVAGWWNVGDGHSQRWYPATPLHSQTFHSACQMNRCPWQSARRTQCLSFSFPPLPCSKKPWFVS